VIAEDGTWGIGEGWSKDNETAPFHAHLARRAPTLIGTDSDAIAAAWRHLWSEADWAEAAVASAVDMALWDLRGRVLGRPLHALLGPEARAVPVYASGGLYADGQNHADLAAEMRGYVARGFRAVKLKIGAWGLDDDLARVAAVRAVVGPDTGIIVDALSRLPPAEADGWLEHLARQAVVAVQAPIATSDLARLARLRRCSPVTIIVGEAEFRSDMFQELLDRRAVGCLQLCPAVCGGVTGTLRIARMAGRSGVPVTLQCHGTAVLQAACFHIAAACPAVESVEYHMFHTHLHAALPPEMRHVANGQVNPGRQPGLGLDEPVLADLREVATFT
jgi:L-alanine-DL-glutamate epimerase-like enolase superfamily enzyme